MHANLVGAPLLPVGVPVKISKRSNSWKPKSTKGSKSQIAKILKRPKISNSTIRDFWRLGIWFSRFWHSDRNRSGPYTKVTKILRIGFWHFLWYILFNDLSNKKLIIFSHLSQIPPFKQICVWNLRENTNQKLIVIVFHWITRGS